METMFVYGSLKRGFSNHHLLLHAQYLGQGTTKQGVYRLVSLGRYPAVLKGGRHRICGELYQVDSHILNSLDILEEHPDVYCREKVTVLSDSGEQQAWIYVLVADLAIEEQNFVSPNPLTWTKGLQVIQCP